eukprot:jgi/Chrpa1/26669/Chrysochromulina_OHIO_Genome00008204-RA
MTESMMWMTPLVHSMSVVVTLAPSTMTPSLPTLMVTSAPLTVGTFAPSMVTTVLAITLPGTTWYVRMAASLALFSGLRRSSMVPAGSLAKAASVGANTVKGPTLFMVSTRPAAPSAAARVLKAPAPPAVSTMSAILGAAGAGAGAGAIGGGIESIEIDFEIESEIESTEGRATRSDSSAAAVRWGSSSVAALACSVNFSASCFAVSMPATANPLETARISVAMRCAVSCVSGVHSSSSLAVASS